MFNTNAQCYQSISQVLLTSAFILWPTLRAVSVFGKKSDAFAVFWRIFVRFCGFRTPLMPPSFMSNINCKMTSADLSKLFFNAGKQKMILDQSTRVISQFLPSTSALLMRLQSTLSKTDTFGTGTKCPS